MDHLVTCCKLVYGKKLRFPKKKKITQTTQIKAFLVEKFLAGTSLRGRKIFRPLKMLVFAMIIVF